MTRRDVMIVLALLHAVGVGSSSSAVTNTRDQVGYETGADRPDAEARAEGKQVSSDALPPYEPVAGLTGKIISIGASTTTNLVARVAAEFRRMYPKVVLADHREPYEHRPLRARGGSGRHRADEPAVTFIKQR